MIGQIEIKGGGAGWRRLRHCSMPSGPGGCLTRLPWGDVVWAEPDWRVLVSNLAYEIVGKMKNPIWRSHGILRTIIRSETLGDRLRTETSGVGLERGINLQIEYCWHSHLPDRLPPDLHRRAGRPE
jgi:hypothetical protein